MAKSKFRSIPFFIWLAVIAVMCLLPSKDLPSSNWLNFKHADKLVHLVLYTILFLSFCWWHAPNNNLALLIIIMLIIAFFGLLIELIQHYLVLGRYGDVNDWIANMMGIPIGIVLWKVWKKHWPWPNKATVNLS